MSLPIEREDVEQQAWLLLRTGKTTAQYAKQAGWRDCRDFVSKGRTVLRRMEATDIALLTGRHETALADRHDVGVILDALEGDYRNVATCLMEGMTQGEIAANLGVSQATVSRLVLRIRKIAESL